MKERKAQILVDRLRKQFPDFLISLSEPVFWATEFAWNRSVRAFLFLEAYIEIAVPSDCQSAEDWQKLENRMVRVLSIFKENEK